jgi:heptosyltransferase-2
LKKLDPSKIEKIMIRSTNWIGDAVMTTPALAAVRKFFPASEITLVANPIVAELFREHSDCDRVLVFDKKGEHKGPAGFWRFCRMLRRQKFDLAILFQNAIEAAFMAFFAGIPQRAGYATEGRGLLLTQAVVLGASEKTLHHTDYYLHMLKQIGIGNSEAGLRLMCSDKESKWAEGILRWKRWVAVNPGAAYGDAKRWFPERFAQVADTLQDEFGVGVIMTGASAEADIGRDIENLMRNQPLNMIGKTTVRQLMAVLSQCVLVITNDSGPMHIAAALNVPIAAIFGPTDHTTTSPLGENNILIRKDVPCSPCLLRHCPTDHRCMKEISADDVLEAARSLLQRNQ